MSFRSFKRRANPAVRTRRCVCAAGPPLAALLSVTAAASAIDPQAEWMRLNDAARRGETEAQLELAERHARDPDREAGAREAVLWWAEAARRGNPDAIARLAAALEAGRGIPADPARARLFWRRAAELGNAEAPWRLARLPAEGDEANAWLARAADRGHPEALFERAERADRAPVGARDTRRALEDYRRAAFAGHRAARQALALRLAQGYGAPADFEAAYFWSLAAAGTPDDDADLRAAIAARLSGAARRRIRREAEAFLAELGVGRPEPLPPPSPHGGR